MVAKELWSVARDKKLLPVKKKLVAKELFSIAKDKKSLPFVKLIKMTSHSITMETESRRYFRF